MRLTILAALAVLIGASARAAESAPYAVPGGAVLEIADAKAQRTYKMFVKTPPGYGRAENAARLYPVIYLNDGELYFLAAAGAPLLSYHSGLAEEAIVVGFSYAQGEDPIASRQRDLTPVRNPSFANETGGAAAYLDFLLKQAIPLIEATYRADPERRTLAGHSLGATFAAYVLFTEPETFENYILVSPALWYADHSIAGFESLYAQTHRDLPARVYVAVGELEGPKGGLKAIDMVNDAVAFSARLRSRNYPGLALREDVIAGADHATAFPAAYLRALGWLFPARGKAPAEAIP